MPTALSVKTIAAFFYYFGTNNRLTPASHIDLYIDLGNTANWQICVSNIQFTGADPLNVLAVQQDIEQIKHMSDRSYRDGM